MKKKDKQPEEASQTENQAAESPKPPKLPKDRSPLLIFLTILLVLVGLGEAGLWGCFGLGTYRNSLALRQYEAQQKAYQEERASKGVLGGSAYGPNLKVENGVVTWQREDKLSGAIRLPSQELGYPKDGGEKRLSRLSVFRVPYALADMEEETAQPPAAEDSAVPTTT